MEILVESQISDKKPKFFWVKIEVLVKNRNFGENPKFSSKKKKFWPKTEIVVKN